MTYYVHSARVLYCGGGGGGGGGLNVYFYFIFIIILFSFFLTNQHIAVIDNFLWRTSKLILYDMV